MPDFQQLVITDLTNVTVSVPRYQISVLITDSKTGATILDLTGANVVNFPGFLNTLTAQQRHSLLRGLVRRALLMLAGLDDGSVSDI